MVSAEFLSVECPADTRRPRVCGGGAGRAVAAGSVDTVHYQRDSVCSRAIGLRQHQHCQRFLHRGRHRKCNALSGTGKDIYLDGAQWQYERGVHGDNGVSE